jgi:putative oxidoreductase
MSAIVAFVGRLLIALLFFFSGIQKLVDPGPAAQLLTSVGLQANLAVPTGVCEIVAGVLLAIGLMTRLVSILLAAYVALTILFFHHEFTTPMGQAEVLSHLALIGGLLMVFAYGQMRWSYDHWRARDKVRKAELRAAHAEGKAEGATAVAGRPATTTVVRDVPPNG